MYHQPVLLTESVDLLNIKKGGIYIDVTFGGGGHSREILSRLGDGKLIAFDRDPDAQRNLIDDDRLIFIPGDFKFIESLLTNRDIGPVDGILADLGVSSHQFDTPERGFSYRFDAPIDMRMNPAQTVSASTLLNEADAERLYFIFRTYGELNNAKKLVQNIVQARAEAAIESTRRFESVIQNCIPPKRRAKYMAQVYQALRIEVNGELESLEQLLFASLSLLKIGGRMVIIAYHSLEDRMVKRFFQSGNLAGRLEKDFYGNPLTPWKRITRKAIQANSNETNENSRARSARLRAAERIEISSSKK